MKRSDGIHDISIFHHRLPPLVEIHPVSKDETPSFSIVLYTPAIPFRNPTHLGLSSGEDVSAVDDLEKENQGQKK